MFGAVATSWNQYYPGTERTKHLYDFTLNALQTRRKQAEQAELFDNIPVEEVFGLPDITLSTVDGTKVSLSSLKGKVVLLDFVVYNAEFSPKHNIDLNNLYAKYRSRGFEIYQVSFDSDLHFWKTSAANLPWVTVRDPQSVNASLLATYNVREIPTAFLIDRQGDVVARIENYDQLSVELRQFCGALPYTAFEVLIGLMQGIGGLPALGNIAHQHKNTGDFTIALSIGHIGALHKTLLT